MTRVAVLLTRPTSNGAGAPVRGYQRWEPTARRVIEGNPDNIVMPIGFDVPLGLVPSFVTVAPTTAEWVWAVTLVSSGKRGDTEYFAVPDVPEVDFTDLVQLDPGTLNPAAVPQPAWYALVAAIQASQVGIVIVAANDDPRPTANVVLWFGGAVRPANMLSTDVWFGEVL